MDNLVASVAKDDSPMVSHPWISLFMNPTFVSFLDFDVIARIPMVNKSLRQCVTEDPDLIGYWQSLTAAFAYHCDLCFDGICANAKQYFFRELWPARNKWAKAKSEYQHLSFQVKVACRFRPGLSAEEKLMLPLHQFLKIRRRKPVAALSEKAENVQSSFLVGQADPTEFLDPFLGTLMKDPVLLKSSGRIVERTIAVQSLLRRGRDPFNNKKLTSAMIESQTELASQIAEWRKKKEAEFDVSLSMAEAKAYVNDNTVDPNLLEALVEAERLQLCARRAEIDASDETGHWQERNRLEESGDVDSADFGGEQVQGDHLTYIENSIQNQNPDPNTSENVSDRARNYGTDGMCENGKAKARYVSATKVVDVSTSSSFVSMTAAGMGLKSFHFSHVHDGSAAQKRVYNVSVKDSVVAALNGFNATVLCYGQTGSGKTHTFFGPDDVWNFNISDVDDPSTLPSSTGMVVRALIDIFRAKVELAQRKVVLSVSLQFVEIYHEQLTDLLSGTNCTVRRDTGELAGASEAVVDGMASAMDLLQLGNNRKRFAATAMNQRSSRSHSVLVLKLSQYRSKQDADLVVSSQLTLVDLAGSERVKKSKAEGARFKEAVTINSSLLVLGKVIAALVESKIHVPYLESKLTTLLKSAFGGTSRTTAIINCRMDDDHADETLHSLRFGERCSMISNTVVQLASSAQAAREAITDALQRVRQQLQSLEGRGKQHLDTYKTLLNSYKLLEQKEKDITASLSSAVAI